MSGRDDADSERGSWRGEYQGPSEYGYSDRGGRWSRGEQTRWGQGDMPDYRDREGDQGWGGGSRHERPDYQRREFGPGWGQGRSGSGDSRHSPPRFGDPGGYREYGYEQGPSHERSFGGYEGFPGQHSRGSDYSHSPDYGRWARHGGSQGDREQGGERWGAGGRSYGMSQSSSNLGHRGDRDDAQSRGERGFRGKGPKGYTRSDDAIRADVCERLEDADLDPSDIVVDVHQGQIKLSGTIDNRWDKREVEDIAFSVRGVKDVRNDIRVESESDSDSTRREQDSKSAGRSQGMSKSMSNPSSGMTEQQQPRAS